MKDYRLSKETIAELEKFRYIYTLDITQRRDLPFLVLPGSLL